MVLSAKRATNNNTSQTNRLINAVTITLKTALTTSSPLSSIDKEDAWFGKNKLQSKGWHSNAHVAKPFGLKSNAPLL